MESVKPPKYGGTPVQMFAQFKFVPPSTRERCKIAEVLEPPCQDNHTPPGTKLKPVNVMMELFAAAGREQIPGSTSGPPFQRCRRAVVTQIRLEQTQCSFYRLKIGSP